MSAPDPEYFWPVCSLYSYRVGGINSCSTPPLGQLTRAGCIYIYIYIYIYIGNVDLYRYIGVFIGNVLAVYDSRKVRSDGNCYTVSVGVVEFVKENHLTELTAIN